MSKVVKVSNLGNVSNNVRNNVSNVSNNVRNNVSNVSNVDKVRIVIDINKVSNMSN